MAQALWNGGTVNNGIAVNAAVADSVVTNFGGATAAGSEQADWILCIDGIYFDAVAAVDVRIYLAPIQGDTEDNRSSLLDSAGIGAQVQHWVGPSFNVPRTQITVGIWQPHLLLITKSVGNAKVRVHWSWRPPGSC